MLVQLPGQPQVGLLLSAPLVPGAFGFPGLEPNPSRPWGRQPPRPGCRDSDCETVETGQGNLKRFVIENNKEFIVTYSYTNVFLPL